MIDWTTVIAAAIPTVPATLALFVGAQNRRHLMTPSGDTIGQVVERTHDLAAVATLTNIGASRTAGSEPSPVIATPPMERAVERLNEDERSPVKVNGDQVHS